MAVRKGLPAKIPRAWLVCFLSWCLLVGLAAARLQLKLPVLIIVLVFLVIFRFPKAYRLVLISGLVLGIFGFLKGQSYMEKLGQYQGLYDKNSTYLVRAANDGVYGAGSQMLFTANQIRAPDGSKLIGKIQVSGYGVNNVLDGDELKVTGKIRPTLGANPGRISYAQLQLVRHHPSLISEIRRRFNAGLGSALPEPYASFTMGLLIGQRSTLPDTVKEDLLKVGLTHIIAVSGYNLTIVLHASKRLLAKRSKRLATLLAFGLMAGFLLMTGLSASIVRAAMVSTLSIWAAYYGRTLRPLVILSVVAALTAWANPVYLWSDASWYLSFLAFFGILIVAPVLRTRLPQKLVGSLAGSVALESIAAEIMTLPYVLHMFGQMSAVGLLANVLITTLVPLAMLTGFIAGLAGMLIWPLAGWLAWPAKWVLWYMLGTTALLASPPQVFMNGVIFGVRAMWLTYALIIAAVTALAFKSRPENVTITDNRQQM